ncbi:Crp/Fnr family transcriptional regulator [Leisingera sp.]|uniref:Crp/Fnr family transcriptional regulator n=1 Tax=Leisingera sp. TaxID=1879318 RepID=UPI002B273BBD|nr:Crp/Fnr family transcriptional regulator [Leisingera sp.]
MHFGNATAIITAGRCQGCPAERLGICGAAGGHASTAFAKRARLARFRSGDTILPQGEEAGHAGIIIDGTVKIVNVTEGGSAHVLQLLQPGELIGTLFPGRTSVAWEAANEVSLCWIALPALNALIQQEPMLGQALLASASRQLNAQWEWAVLLRGGSTLRRIANWILRQAGEAAGAGDCGSQVSVVVIELRRRDLASLLDMTVETLCRGLHQLEQHRAIVMLTPKQAAISDIGTLQMLAQSEH